MMRLSSMRTKEKAPSSLGSTSTRARSRARPSLDSSVEAGSSRWIISATRSLSLVTMPGNIPASRARASVLTRLPLWPRANWPAGASRNTGWALRQLEVPDVE